MPEKRIRIGSGIRLGRKPKQTENIIHEQLGRVGRPVVSGDNNDTVALGATPVEATPDDLASIFKTDRQPSNGLNADTNSDNLVVPPPISTSEEKKAPLLNSKDLSFEQSDLLQPKPTDFTDNAHDPSLNFDVPAIEGIDNATGNYLLTLGYPGSGKTVLQSFIYYYIATHGAFFGSLERHRKGAQPSNLTQSLLNKWVKDWSDRKFPQSNRESVDAIREIRLRLTPKINTSKSFNFSFVEVSGELIKSVVPTEVQAGLLVDTMHNFLTAPKSKKIIVYVFDHNEGSNNDELFSSLIQYLEGTVAGKLDQSYSLMIVVPNPDLVLQRVSSDERMSRTYSNINELTPEAMLHYLRLKAPQLVTTFRHWKKSKRGVFKFHIGKVTENADGERILESYDFKDSGRITEFCYQQFHGIKLTESWFQRLIKALRE
jgi:hypothetical protein